MKNCLRILFLLLLAGCANQPPGAAYSYPADAPARPGKVTFYIVTGVVQLRAPDGTPHPAKRGDTFGEGSTLVAEKGGNALLVFSNGATLKVLEGTDLAVVKFRQAAFDEQTEGAFLRLNKDPSRSNVLLELRKGTVQGEVKKLNTAAGSSFVVLTPAGAVNVNAGQPLKATAMDRTGRYRMGAAPELRSINALGPLPPPPYDPQTADGATGGSIFNLTVGVSPGDPAVATVTVSCYFGRMEFRALAPVAEARDNTDPVLVHGGHEMEFTINTAAAQARTVSRSPAAEISRERGQAMINALYAAVIQAMPSN